MAALYCFSLIVCLAVAGVTAIYPFQNTSLPINERVKDLVGRLTLDEIVGQMAHGGAASNSPAPAISRLGIKPYQWGTECLSGDVGAGPATSFPQAIGMSATFNNKTVFAVAKATSDEVRAKNNNYTAHGDYSFHTGLSCWSPVINILRDPRWGRNQETYGEDPWLSGHLARAYVTGLQGDNPRYLEANAGCKHFDVHGGPENIPVSRFSFNSVVSMQDWRMTFLPQFKACVEAGSMSLMCSYNSINGVPACANSELLNEILRNEWGFQGYVVSDQGALENILIFHKYTSTVVQTAAAAVNGGTDLEDGNSFDGNIFDSLGDAVSQGLTNKSALMESASRLFTVRMMLGEFDPPDMNPYTKLKVSDYVQSPAHQQLANEAAMETFVLLKNTLGKGLPLTSAINTACVVGPFIDTPSLLFGDYAPIVMKEYVVTPLAGIKTMTQIGTQSLKSAPGCNDGPVCNQYDSGSVTGSCSGMDIAIVVLGTGNDIEREGHDRADINLPGQQLQLLQDAANSASGPTVLVLYNAGPLDISWAKQSNKVVAILEGFFPAQSAGSALAAVLTGKYNPAGRLPNTWPANLTQVPPITNYTMMNRTYRYFEGIPLYPFGYGLSYTTFQYSSLSLSPSTIKAGESVMVKVQVANTGSMDGDEVTQVYISWRKGVPGAPFLQLVGVRRSMIKSGSGISLTFTITSTEMQLFTTQWVIPSGEIDVFVGGQQPHQTTQVPSNVLQSSFTVQ